MEKMISLVRQILNFGIVGILCFIVDYIIMLLLVELIKLDYLIACGIAFTVSTIVNYFLSMKYVFYKSNKMDKKVEFIFFSIMAIIGLVLTEILMFFCVESINIHYTISKVIATAIVMIYNFITRKIMFERKGKSK